MNSQKSGVNSNTLTKKEKKILWIATIAIFGLFSFLKLFQHYTFNTYGYDLGIRASIIWNILNRGRVWDSLHQAHGFSGHFHPISFLFVPFFWLWRDARVLLLLKTLALSFSIFPCYLLSKKITNEYFAILFSGFFFLNPYFHEVLRFDFHPEVFAIPLILFCLYFVERGDYKKFWFSLPPLLLLKEDAAILFFGFAIFLTIFKKRWKEGIFLAGIGIFWLFLSLFLLLPYWAGNTPSHVTLHYKNLGSSVSEIIRNSLLNPILVLKNSFLDFQKLKSVIQFFLSFGFLPIFSPSRLIILLPNLLEHLLSWYPHQWQLTHQYSTYILPLSFYVSLYGIKRLKKWSLFSFIAIITAAFLYFPNYFKEGINLKRSHMIHQVAQNIHPFASLSTNNNLVPHLVMRDTISFFPNYEEKEYILVDMKGNLYPCKWEERWKVLEKIKSSGKYNLIFGKDSLFLFKRKP